jgi:condensation domain-containing protein
MAPDSAAYNVTVAVLIRSPLDESRLERAVVALEERHDVLRSTFVEIDGMPWRVIHPVEQGRSAAFTVRDVGRIDDLRLRTLAHQQTTKPFPLTDGGRGFRVVLLRRGPDDAILVLAAHHIVVDAFSLFLMLRDLLDAYRALGDDPSAPPLAPLRRRYQDFVTTERELLESARGKALAAHWREVCTGSMAAMLQPDRPAPVRTRYVGASCELRTAPDFPVRLRAAAAALRANPFAYLLGTFEAMLHRLTGQDDFLIGMSVAARAAPGMRDLVGYLVNTLPLRARFGPAASLADAVASAKQQVASGLVNMAYPVQLMVDTASAAPAATRPPLFRITFTMLADHYVPFVPPIPSGDELVGPEIEYAGIRLAYFELPQQEGQFDLSVEMRQVGPLLTGVFRYNTELFDRATIEALVEQYGRLLEVAVAAPGTRIRDVSLVDDVAVGPI